MLKCVGPLDGLSLLKRFEIVRPLQANTDNDVAFKVEASMMEIYNERVRDLFNPKHPKNEQGLKVCPMILWQTLHPKL